MDPVYNCAKSEVGEILSTVNMRNSENFANFHVHKILNSRSSLRLLGLMHIICISREGTELSKFASTCI